MITKILVDFDTNHLSGHALSLVLELASAARAEVMLLVVRPQICSLTAPAGTDFETAVRQQLGPTLAPLRQAALKLGVPLDLHVVASGDLVDTLLDFARLNQFDLLVTGKQNEDDFKTRIQGVPWKQLAIHAEIPVLVCP